MLSTDDRKLSGDVSELIKNFTERSTVRYL